MRKCAITVLAVATIATLCAAFASSNRMTTRPTASRVTLKPCHVEGVKEELRCGKYEVFENRKTQAGRKLPLKIVVIPARQAHPEQGPVFYMAGGPGESATELAALVMTWGDADEHDV